MCGFLLRSMINAVVLYVVVVKLPGIFVDTLGGELLGAAIIGIANGIIRPLFFCTAIPFNTLTLGGLTFFTNLFTPLMVFKAVPGFQISSFLSPLAGILFLTACSFTVTKMIHDR